MGAGERGSGRADIWKAFAPASRSSPPLPLSQHPCLLLCLTKHLSGDWCRYSYSDRWIDGWINRLIVLWFLEVLFQGNVREHQPCSPVSGERRDSGHLHQNNLPSCPCPPPRRSPASPPPQVSHLLEPKPSSQLSDLQSAGWSSTVTVNDLLPASSHRLARLTGCL